MLEGTTVGNAKTVPVKENEKIENNKLTTVTEKINNPFVISDKGKFSFQLKGVPASSLEFKSNKIPFANDNSKVNIDLYIPNDPSIGNSVVEINVSDAVSVNKSYDIHPKLKNNVNIKTEFDKWAVKCADILEANNACIVIAAKDGTKCSVNPKFLKNLAEVLVNDRDKGYLDIRHFFRDDLGISFFNTIWAIDDLVNNLNTDPYYLEIKEEKKSFDLASVGKTYHLDNDKADYFAMLNSHGHRIIPVNFESALSDITATKLPPATPGEVIKKLSESFDAKGNLKDGESFEKQVYELLDDPDSRKGLIEHFKLNSKENINSLVPAITGEAGVSKTQQDYNSYFCVGSVILNRTLGRNLKKYAKATAQKIPEAKIKPVTVKSILFEKGQFAITWEKVLGVDKTIFDYQTSLNDLFKKGKIKENGNSFSAFNLVNEVVTDLLGGMKNLKADINGESKKNTGRSTSDLFYFNQSHNDDYTGKSPDAAVKFIDVNNTQVFFKSWDGAAFFRYE